MTGISVCSEVLIGLNIKTRQPSGCRVLYQSQSIRNGNEIKVRIAFRAAFF